MCGQLHCSPAGNNVSFQTMVYLIVDSHITVGRNRYECDSVIVDVGTQYTDPGLAPDGAKCGDGKVVIYYFTVFYCLRWRFGLMVCNAINKVTQRGPG